MAAIENAGTTGNPTEDNDGTSPEQIVEAAADALAAAGSHDDLYGEVSRAAGVSRDAVAGAFPAEHDLLLAVLDLRDTQAEQFMAP
jgi:hypothetical protein